MDITRALHDHGIRLRDYRPGEHRSTCPQCSAQRRKKKDPCLAVKIDHDGGAAWTCHHCGWTGNVPGGDREHSSYRPRKPVRPKPVENPDQPRSMYDWFAARGISQATVDRIGCYVTEQWFPQTGKNERCIAFPYRRAGELVNHKYRTADKHFRQDKDAERTLYNIDAIEGYETVYIVEGEMDVAAMIEAGFDATISLPDGAPAKAKDDPDPDDKRYEAIRICEAELAHVKRFILAGDADGPGRAHVEEIARRLGRERCWLVRWPTLNDAPRKDANEVLQHDGAEVLRECVEAANPYPIADLYEADAYEDRLFTLYREGRDAGLSTGWPKLDAHMRLRAGDLSIWTGIPSHGKSEFLDALMVNMARLHGWHFAVCSFENQPEEHISKLAEKYLHAPFWDGPTTRMSESELRSAVEWIRGHFVFIRADVEAPTIEWLIERAKAAVLRYGIKGLVCDPWNEHEARRPGSMSETEYTSDALGKLRRFAQTAGCHVWLVAHPMKMRRADNGEVPAPTLYDISGSAHFANKADLGVTIHRPDLNQPITEVYVRKVRRKWLGSPGMITFAYDRATGDYREASA